MRQFDLANPHRPTRVSGAWMRPLREWAERRNRRLPDRGGHLPWHGRPDRLADGSLGGVPRQPFDLNVEATKNPILQIPSGAAQRVEAERRRNQRQRRAQAATKLIVLTGPGGLDYATGPRIRPRTPSFVRGVLRDMRNAVKGVQYYGQAVAPASVVRASNDARIGARSAAHVFSVPPRDVDEAPRGPAADHAQALRTVLRTSSVAFQSPAPGNIVPAPAAPNLLPLLAVVAAFFFVFRGR